MRNKKFLPKALCFSLSAAMLFGGLTLPVNAQTLSEAGLTEETRGYGGKGDQNRSRTEDSITVSVTFGSGGTDASWTGLAELTPYIANDDVEMLNRHVTVSDTDSDGDIDTTDLFRSLESLKRGDIAFNASTSDMGDFYSDMFGVGAGGSFTYWLNGNYCSYGTPDLYDRDNIIAVAFTGEYNSWGETDDSAYDGHKSTTTYTSLSSITSLDSWETSTTNPTDPVEPTQPSATQYNKYIAQVDSTLASSFTLSTTGTGMWQQLRIARFAKGSDKSAFADYQEWFAANHGVTLGSKAVDDMRVLSVYNNPTAINNLLYGPGNTVDDVEDSSDALVYDKKAGQYAMDYILMALDLTEAGMEDDDMTNNLSDYTTTVSVRDDLVYTILNTTNCWGGSWFTYDTGCQNAQALVPYYNRYSEVKTKLDAFEAECYEHFMDASYTDASFDASCAGEYIRFAAMLANETDNATYAQHALDVYNKIETIGLENTKYHGNTMDIWRMAIAEWGLNDLEVASSSNINNDTNNFFLALDSYAVNNGLKTMTTGKIRVNENVDDAQLVEMVLAIPEGVSIENVSSEISTNVEYAIVGSELRVVISSLDGNPLSIVTGKDIINFEILTQTSGTYTIGVTSFGYWKNSEEFVEVSISSKDIEVLAPLTILCKKLYEGIATSKFVPSDKMAVKLTISDDLATSQTVVFTYDNTDYLCYRSSDFTAANGSVYLAVVDKNIALDELTNIENYSVTDVATQYILFGDTNDDKSINSVDALGVVRLWVGKDTRDITSKVVLTYNVTGDSHINNADTLAIVEKVTDSKDWKVMQ